MHHASEGPQYCDCRARAKLSHGTIRVCQVDGNLPGMSRAEQVRILFYQRHLRFPPGTHRQDIRHAQALRWVIGGLAGCTLTSNIVRHKEGNACGQGTRH